MFRFVLPEIPLVQVRAVKIIVRYGGWANVWPTPTDGAWAASADPLDVELRAAKECTPSSPWVSPRRVSPGLLTSRCPRRSARRLPRSSHAAQFALGHKTFRDVSVDMNASRSSPQHSQSRPLIRSFDAGEPSSGTWSVPTHDSGVIVRLCQGSGCGLYV